MKTLTLEEQLPFPIDKVWAILSDVDRCDWVPGVEAITLEGDVRTFVMAGIGEVQERIIRLDHLTHCLQYSAIRTPSGVDHHLATMQLESIGDAQTRLVWTTEIAPDHFAPAIEPAMAASVKGLCAVLAKGD